MSQLFTPLNDEELDRLDTFLLERIPEELEDAAAEVDEGILDISELDGFLTAIISGPAALPPSAWLPVVWGAFEPAWQSQEEAEAVISLILRHMNGIVNTLMEEPERFEPIVLERELEDQGRIVTIVDEWCMGYMKGVGLAAESWRAGGEAVMEMMMPISLFSSERGWAQLDKLEEEEVEVLKRSITPAVRKIHAFWLQQRGRADKVSPFVHDSPPVGRNDPCPCGSGKKFKKCCLH